jgi:hypothetical protein
MRQEPKTPWERIGVSRATWYRHGKPTVKPIRITLEQTAKAMNVSLRSAQRARRIQREAPDLVPLVQARKLTLAKAEQIVKEREEEQGLAYFRALIAKERKGRGRG